MALVDLIDSEHGDENHRNLVVPVGTYIKLSDFMAAEVTQEALDCDCGKGAFCPLNPQIALEKVRRYL